MAGRHRSTIAGALRGSALAAAIALGGTAAAVPPAAADTALSVSVQFPSTYAMGMRAVPASVSVVNLSGGAVPGPAVTVTGILLTPACGSLSSAGVCARVDPGVVRVWPSAVGEALTACAGVPFTATAAGPGRLVLAPATPVVLGSPGELGDTCRVDVLLDVVGAPTLDASPAPGTQTAATASATAGRAEGTAASATGSVLANFSGPRTGGTAKGSASPTPAPGTASAPPAGRGRAGSHTVAARRGPATGSTLTSMSLTAASGRLVPAALVVGPAQPIFTGGTVVIGPQARA